MSAFTPIDTYKNKLIYFEDSEKEKIPGYATSKTTSALQGEIIQILQRMGAGHVAFSPVGKFAAPPTRLGYQITYELMGKAARRDCAALPLRIRTDKKEQQSLKQALYLLRDQLKASLFTSLNEPPANMLVSDVIIDNAGHTVTENLIASGLLNLLPSPTFKQLRSGK